MQDEAGMRAIFHNGDTAGQHAMLMTIPEQRFALVILTNSLLGALVTGAALDAALAQFPALAPLSNKLGMMHATMAPADAPTVSLSPEELAAYPGRYADPGEVFTVTETEDGLELTTEEIQQPGALLPAIALPPSLPGPLAFLAPDSAVANDSRYAFVRDEGSDVKWVAHDLRLTPREGDA